MIESIKGNASITLSYMELSRIVGSLLLTSDGLRNSQFTTMRMLGAEHVDLARKLDDTAKMLLEKHMEQEKP